MTARSQPASWRVSNTRSTTRRTGRLTRGFAAIGLVGVLAACGSDTTDDATADSSAAAEPSSADTGVAFTGTLMVGAIPDQEPERLQRTYDLLSDHLEENLPGITVEYVPVTEYQGAVTGFAVGDLDLVWFGGLTGVQARLEVDGATALLQRDIDPEFTSVFIAGASTGIEPFDSVDGLSALVGRSLTFGSESSTSGRLMPMSFLEQAGVDIDTDLAGEVGFSGSHDATIEVVAAGTYEVGALNSQVWDSRVAEGTVDPTQVVEIFRTPPYFDYHWVAQPGLDETYGDGFTDALIAAFTSLDPDDPADAEILELFGASSFITTTDANYAAIEASARAIGAIR